MKINKVKGTKDYFGNENQKLEILKNVLVDLSKKFNYSRIKFPVLENIDVFKRTLGTETDIVSKEMYSFEDKKGRVLVMRPEGTASTARLVLENKLAELEKTQKLFYMESMFRYERPQKGRQREFIQFGIEKFNAFYYSDDVEAIQFGKAILDKLEINDYQLKINYIGTSETRKQYSEELKQYFESKKELLSDDSQNRLNTNVFRILDSKDEKDIEVNKDAPSISNFLNEDHANEYSKIKDSLNKLNVTFVEDDKLIRGLDYYNGIVFEFISTDSDALGAQSTLIGGGRYDDLISQFDSSKNVPAVGFAAGLERLILAADDYFQKNMESSFDYAILTTSPDYIDNALMIADKLRENNTVEIYVKDSNFSKKTLKAIKDGAKNIVTVNEGSNNDIPEVEVKNINSETSKIIKIEKLGEI